MRRSPWYQSSHPLADGRRRGCFRDAARDGGHGTSSGDIRRSADLRATVRVVQGANITRHSARTPAVMHRNAVVKDVVELQLVLPPASHRTGRRCELKSRRWYTWTVPLFVVELEPEPEMEPELASTQLKTSRGASAPTAAGSTAAAATAAAVMALTGTII